MEWLCELAFRSRLNPAGRGLGGTLGEMPNGLSAGWNSARPERTMSILNLSSNRTTRAANWNGDSVVVYPQSTRDRISRFEKGIRSCRAPIFRKRS
jgi:hypothetical protein